MTDFYVKVPTEKVEFFTALMDNLGLEYQKLFSGNNESQTINEDSEEFFYTDSDD